MELIDTRNRPTFTSPVVTKVLDFLQKNNLNDFADGPHFIEGDADNSDFFVNVFGYTTADADSRIWEAHRDYIDVHCVLTGREIVQYAFLPDCQCGEYEADKDYVPVSAPPVRGHALLEPNFLAVFYPEDAHQTGVAVNAEALAIRKAVFKIKV